MRLVKFNNLKNYKELEQEMNKGTTLEKKEQEKKIHIYIYNNVKVHTISIFCYRICTFRHE